MNYLLTISHTTIKFTVTCCWPPHQRSWSEVHKHRDHVLTRSSNGIWQNAARNRSRESWESRVFSGEGEERTRRTNTARDVVSSARMAPETTRTLRHEYLMARNFITNFCWRALRRRRRRRTTERMSNIRSQSAGNSSKDLISFHLSLSSKFQSLLLLLLRVEGSAFQV